MSDRFGVELDKLRTAAGELATGSEDRHKLLETIEAATVELRGLVRGERWPWTRWVQWCERFGDIPDVVNVEQRPTYKNPQAPLKLKAWVGRGDSYIELRPEADRLRLEIRFYPLHLAGGPRIDAFIEAARRHVDVQNALMSLVPKLANVAKFCGGIDFESVGSWPVPEADRYIAQGVARLVQDAGV